MGHRARSFSVTTCQSRLVLSLCGVLHANCREIPWQLVHWPKNQNVCDVVIVSNLNASERKGGRLLLRGKTVIARKRKKDLTYKIDLFWKKTKTCDHPVRLRDSEGVGGTFRCLGTTALISRRHIATQPLHRVQNHSRTMSGPMQKVVERMRERVYYENH